MLDYLSESTQLLYAQLLDELLHGAYSPRGISFVTRTIKGHDYWYINYVLGSTRQSHYLGLDEPPLRARVEAIKARWREDSPSAEARARLVSMLLAGGATTLTASQGRIIEALEQAGVFLVGGVLVGSHAFAMMGNSLGVKWPRAALRTKDIDIAHDRELHITIPDHEIVLEEVLRRTGEEFLPVPSLSRDHPSTTFKIRGAELSVSLLTPLRGKPDNTPREIPALNAMAAPLRFLDYLLEDVQPAALPFRQGVLVNIPSPARFALHKLVVSQRRPPGFATKARKDITQAEAVLRVLLSDRPGDLYPAVAATREMPAKFTAQLRAALQHLSPELRDPIEALLDQTQ